MNDYIKLIEESIESNDYPKEEEPIIYSGYGDTVRSFSMWTGRENKSTEYENEKVN